MPENETSVTPKGLSSLKLKIIGLAFILLSAFGTAVVGKGLPKDLDQANLTQLTISVIIELVSWVAFPIYAWLLSTGMRHTANVLAYAIRLLALAVVAEVPYDLATTGKIWDISSQNPVFALLVCLGVLYFLQRIKQGSSRVILSMVVVIAGALWMMVFGIGTRLGILPGGVLTLVFVLIFWYLETKVNTMMLVGATIGALAGVFPAVGFIVLHFHNNELGMKPRTQWVFYIMYPVTLLIMGMYGATL